MNELYHHGIKGQKWGIRRFQNDDGSLTMQGKRRYGAGKIQRELNRTDLKRAKYISRNAEMNYRKDRNGVSEATKGILDRRIKNNEKMIRDAEKRIKLLNSLAKEKGYSMSSKDKIRYTHTGRQVVTNLFFGLPGNAILTGIEYETARRVGDMSLAGEVAGKKYRVKKK